MKPIALVLLALLGVAMQSTNATAEPLSSRCIDIRPICSPGTAPICFCESQYSFNCRWVCGSI